MSALGQKRTPEHVRVMSAFLPKVDIGTGFCSLLLIAILLTFVVVTTVVVATSLLMQLL